MADGLAQNLSMELVCGGTRRGFGRPVDAPVALDLSGLSGVVAYQPEELILAVRPATSVAEVQDLLARHGQHLAFEPPDFGPLWGASTGAGSIGGAVMIGRGGPRRLTAGGPRDHCLGLKGVNGFAEIFAAGGRVVKNVTGFDLPKLVAGSFGTLCVATELTLKVLPAPPETATLTVLGLTEVQAMAVMSKALGSPAQVSAAAHLPADVAPGGAAMTLLRLEGVRPSVAARVAHLAELLEPAGPQALLDDEASRAIWKQVADAAWFAGGDEPLWKLSVPPAKGADIGRRLATELSGRCFYDWGGGGIWLELPPTPDAHAAKVRAVLAEIVGGDGHATLMRASASLRAAIPPLQPLAPALAALSERVRRQFDPQDLFNPGRMYA